MPAIFTSYLRVVDPTGRLRLETVRRDEAIRWAQRVFRAEQLTCVIDVVDRAKG